MLSDRCGVTIFANSAISRGSGRFGTSRMRSVALIGLTRRIACAKFTAAPARYGNCVCLSVKRRFQLELCCVLVRPLGAARQTLQRSAAGLTYRALTEPEALAWCSDPELELNAYQVQAAFARGDVCLGAFDGARLVGYGWLAYGPAPHTGGAWVHFDPEARYSYKKFVRPGDRGRRVAHGLSALADAPVFV